MSGVCSKHRDETVADCVMCNTEPWEFIGVTREVWDEKVSYAESEGTMTCPKCGFDGMYRATGRQDGGEFMCPCCGHSWREIPAEERSR
jgi:predicted RNA-binding Zn-ribbon protein involved in translation (DUF1610 family)